MLTSQTARPIELPHEPGVTFEIRQLSHGALKKARDNRMREMAMNFSGLDLSTFLKDVAAPVQRDSDDDDVDLLAGYDMQTILVKGIKSWSYPEKVTPENIEDLDDETAEFVATEIMKISRRTRKQGEASSET